MVWKVRTKTKKKTQKRVKMKKKIVSKNSALLWHTLKKFSDYKIWPFIFRSSLINPVDNLKIPACNTMIIYETLSMLVKKKKKIRYRGFLLKFRKINKKLILFSSKDILNSHNFCRKSQKCCDSNKFPPINQNSLFRKISKKHL